MHSFKCYLFVFCFLLHVFGISLQDSGKLTLKMQPEHFLQINDRNTPQLQLTCNLQDSSGRNVPLSGCEFRFYYELETWPLNEGHASPNHTYGYGQHGRYHGRGLEHGDCGLTLGGYKNGFVYFLGCRVRPALSGGWQYSVMLLSVSSWTSMRYQLEPPGATVALAGSNVTLRGKAEHSLDKCWIVLPPANSPVYLELHSGAASANPSLARYHGAGLAEKECGATFVNVQPERSGLVRGWGSSSSASRNFEDFVELIIATAPESPPLLTVLTPGTLHTGDILEATCLVKNSRPAANISWFLGEDEVRSGISEDGPLDSTWRWNHDPQTVQQRLRLRVVLSDDGKKLLCRAGHLAWASGFKNSTLYEVHVSELNPDSTPATADPCSPTPCRGAHAVCLAEGQSAVCGCEYPYVGNPPSCRPECAVNTDCSSLKACVASRCVDPCMTLACGRGALCDVMTHEATCKCAAGFVGDPRVLCKEETCGRSVINPQLIAGGQMANYGEFPWHAGIYQLATLDGGNTTRYEQICGGTLIRPNFVVTAAHCVFDQGYNRVYPKENYGVALGKILRDWYADLDIGDVQRMRVADIHAHRDFRGEQYAYRYDIAILKLSSSAVMTLQVQVACVDWGNTFNHAQLVIESYGSVAGWGLTNEGRKPSKDLKWVELPWVDVETCHAATRLELRKYLSSDKFCAGYVNRSTSVCAGDSGGGLLFLNATTNRYYLRGVASTSLGYNVRRHLCLSEHYTLFTKVSDFVGWVRKYVGDSER